MTTSFLFCKDNKPIIKQIILLDLQQDIPDKDITSLLFSDKKVLDMKIIAKQDCTICGIELIEAVLNQTAEFLSIEKNFSIQYFCKDGEQVKNKQTIAKIKSNARLILSAERTIINLIQTLSYTATLSHSISQWDIGKTKILDTRKTLPALRILQKYAVFVGGLHNHRMDLSDEFLIKENHIKACGSIQNAVNKAREIAPNKKIELEVETISQFEQALELNVDIVMLDNFDFEQMKQAVKIKEEIKSQTQIEVSGINFCQEEVEKIASLNVDRISIGAITKNCQAIDFSMLATK